LKEVHSNLEIGSKS